MARYATSPGSLTPREQEVLDAFLVEGRCDKELAPVVGLSLNTFKQMMQSILVKRNVTSRAELAVKELRRNHE